MGHDGECAVRGREGRERRCALFLRTSVLAFRLRALLSRVPLAALLLVANVPEDDWGLDRLAARSPDVPTKSARASCAAAGQAGSFIAWTGGLARTGVLRTN